MQLASNKSRMRRRDRGRSIVRETSRKRRVAARMAKKYKEKQTPADK